MYDAQLVDLHCHSTYSDGTLSPAALAQRASAAGVRLWSLTDHDEIAGLPHAQAAAAAQDMDFLTGVEISASFAQHTVHIVGLGFDPQHPALVAGLQSVRDSRIPRAQAMAEQLQAVGIHAAYAGALRYAGNPALIARTHFARFLVDQGICRNTAEVFRHYLVEGKPGFVPQQWASLAQAVHWICAAGGVAVLAHPDAYDLSPNLQHALLQTFRDAGGQALEAVTGSHPPHAYKHYAQIAQEWGLAISRGSDFHSPQESKVDFAGLPADPIGSTPVWQLLEHRIIRAPRMAAP